MGITVFELFKLFPDDRTAEKWFEARRRESGRNRPDGGSLNSVEVKSRKPMPYRCRDCRNDFSVRKGTVLHSSKWGLQKWTFCLYLVVTGIKGTSSMKIYRELGIRQTTAWHLMHRIRECWTDSGFQFEGPIEVGETYIGGKESNKHTNKKLRAGRGAVGKITVVGAKDRETGKVNAMPVSRRYAETLGNYIVYAPNSRSTLELPQSCAVCAWPPMCQCARYTSSSR